MEQLLKKLLEANVLSEETKSELEVAIKAQLAESITGAVALAEADTRAELTSRWLEERDALIEAIDNKMSSALVDEISELKEDIERFRDLEAEYSQKLIEAKVSMKNELKTDLKELVEKLDTFLEIRLNTELQEFKEDIQAVRQNDFGRRIFEAVSDEFLRNYADEEGMGVSLKETESRLVDATEALEESERRVADLERKIKLEKVLEPLSGKQREVMEAILKNVKTKQLEEGYNTFIGRVIRESDDKTSGKETKVLAESTAEKKPGVLLTGDNQELLESDNKQSGKMTDFSELRRLAGL